MFDDPVHNDHRSAIEPLRWSMGQMQIVDGMGLGKIKCQADYPWPPP
jgi:hypothetical protein